MNISTPSATNRSFRLLRQLAAKQAPVERCELCATEMPGGHEHLLDPIHRKVICACHACAVLFCIGGQTKYKRVPRRVRFLPDFRLEDGQWDSLMIPINMAFFFDSTPDQRMVALYPSPAGPVESLLRLESWSDIVRDNPALEEMEADVEALLVNRIGQSRGAGRAEYYLAPIDECYKLVGLIRGRWRGFSGGTEVWQEIGRFFEGLRAKACLT